MKKNFILTRQVYVAIITYECNIHNIIFFKLIFKIIKFIFLMQIMYFLKHGEKNKQKNIQQYKVIKNILLISF